MADKRLIEQGERLAQLKSMGGYVDVFRISEELMLKATDDCFNFPGWDTQQLSTRVAAAQAAREFHAALFQIINQRIEEARAESMRAIEEEQAQRSAQEVVEDADQLRTDVLQHLDERIAGSY